MGRGANVEVQLSHSVLHPLSIEPASKCQYRGLALIALGFLLPRWATGWLVSPRLPLAHLISDEASSAPAAEISVACVDQATDHQGRQDHGYASIVRNHYSPPTRRQPDMVNRGDRILMTVGSAHRKRHERRQLQASADILNHATTILGLDAVACKPRALQTLARGSVAALPRRAVAAAGACC